MSARGNAPAPQADPLELLEPGEDVFFWVSRDGQATIARAPDYRRGPTGPAALFLGGGTFEDGVDTVDFRSYANVAHYDVRSLPERERAATTLHGTLDAPSDRDAWRSLVARALTVIDSGAASKIVCARRVRLRAMASIDAAGLAASLLRAEGTYRYLVRENDVIFAGASPERLIEKHGDLVRTEAVAGTAAVDHGGTPLEQREKDRREHLAVVLAIEESLAPHALALEHSDVPLVRRVGRIEHLFTPFEGRVDPAKHILELAEALHPTPAVAGTPRDVALRFIADNEALPRGGYAGPVGWFDANGDGELAVALRCVRIEGSAVDLYAGAGVVSGSDPDAEFDETVLKMRSTLASLGFEIAP